jgi:Zn finger protein HypA/HybF involved in hydrogenase expression
MAEYIEREAVLEELIKLHDDEEGNHDRQRAVIRAHMRIQDIHAADVAPVRRGKWVYENGEQAKKNVPIEENPGRPRCSSCGGKVITYSVQDMGATMVFPILTKHCPDCGAKMNLKEDVDNG